MFQLEIFINFFFNPVSANIFTLDTLEIQYYRNITTSNLLNARDVNRYWIQMKNNGPARHPNSLCDGNIRVSNTLACLRSNSIYFVFRFATPRLRGDFKFKVPGPCPGPKQIQLSFRNLQLKKKQKKRRRKKHPSLADVRSSRAAYFRLGEYSNRRLNSRVYTKLARLAQYRHRIRDQRDKERGICRKRKREGKGDKKYVWHTPSAARKPRNDRS